MINDAGELRRRRFRERRCCRFFDEQEPPAPALANTNAKIVMRQKALPLPQAEIACNSGETCVIESTSKNGFCDGKGGEFRMGKRIVLLSGVTLFALTLTLGGCGKKEEPAPPPPPAPAESAAPAPAESAAPAPAESAAPGGEMKAPAEQPATGAAAQPEKKEESKTK